MNINGIILTEKAQETLLRFQAENNCSLKCAIKDINNISKKIAIEGSIREDSGYTLADIAFLFTLCNDLEDLFAVEEEGGTQ